MKIGKRVYPKSVFFWIPYTNVGVYIYNTLRQRLNGELVDKLYLKIKNDLPPKT